MSISVTTRSYSNLRDGANMAETILASSKVQVSGINHLFDIALADDGRGTEGMPLVAAGLTMSDGLPHDVLYTATMANDVYAFDANTGQMLWKQHVGNPIANSRVLDMYLIQDHWGILSTPVINLATRTIYVVSMSSPDGQIGDSRFSLHALSLIDGSHQDLPLNLNAASYRKSTMGAVPRKQRCGLLFDSRNGVDTVFVCNGSFNEDADTNQGWIIACDVTGLKLSIATAWTTTSLYSGGGLWNAGQGPSMDADGFLYVMTGNGSFSPPDDLSECFVKLRYTPKTATAPASIVPIDWWSPYTDTGRVGGDPTLASVSLIPNWWDNDPGGTSNMDSPGDQDLNSGGPLLLPMSLTGFSKDLIIGAGKDGIAYVVDAQNMGRTQLADFAPDKIAGNYAKLLLPPYGFTYYPAGLDIAPTDLSKLSTTYFGYTHHQHSTPVCYNSPDHGFLIFTGGENGPVRVFTLKADFSLNYLGCSAEIASLGVPAPGGMPGTMMTLSANGNVPNTAILWCAMPYGDANKTITTGRLIAYGANWFNNGTLIKIWDSSDHGITFPFNKFNIPCVANGKIFVPTYDGRIMVYG